MYDKKNVTALHVIKYRDVQHYQKKFTHVQCDCTCIKTAACVISVGFYMLNFLGEKLNINQPSLKYAFK